MVTLRKYGKALVLAMAAASAGCAHFENRVVMTLPGDELHMLSKYGPYGISSKISDKDRDTLIRAFQAAAGR